MGEMLTLTAEDGFKLSVYRANPSGKPRGTLVIVQEIFGVNSHMKHVCDGFAADGYVALAPALFDRVEPGYATGYSPAEIERGRNVRGKLGWDTMVMDLRAAVDELRKVGLPIGVVGYCMGGSMAGLAGARVGRVAAGGCAGRSVTTAAPSPTSPRSGSAAPSCSPSARPTRRSPRSTGTRSAPPTPKSPCIPTRPATGSTATSAAATTSQAPDSRASARSSSCAVISDRNMGGPDMAPIPSNARTAPAETWRSSILRQGPSLVLGGGHQPSP